MSARRIEITVSAETYGRLESARGHEPRASFVKRALDSMLSGSLPDGRGDRLVAPQGAVQDGVRSQSSSEALESALGGVGDMPTYPSGPEATAAAKTAWTSKALENQFVDPIVDSPAGPVPFSEGSHASPPSKPVPRVQRASSLVGKGEFKPRPKGKS